MSGPTKTPLGAIIHRDANGEVDWFMVPEQPTDAYCFSATAYEITAWYRSHEIESAEVAVISLKWDGCSHVGLRSPELDKNWVHVCGPRSMEQILAMLRWMWLEAQARIERYDPDEKLAAHP